MKCGIKALFITLAIATTGMSAGALATTPAAKTPAVQSRSDAAAPAAGQTKATDAGKSADDDGTRVSINSAATAAEAIHLQQDLLLTFHNLVKLILAFLNLTTERVNIVLVVGKLLLELG